MSPDEVLDRIRRSAMPDGSPAARGAWLRQEGEMRLTPDGPWRVFHAQQWFLGSGVAFRWHARLRIAPFLIATVLDSFEDGKASLRALLFGIIPIARSGGEACNRGEAMRGLAELPWRPWAFRESPPLTWTAVGPQRLRGSFDDGRTRASAEFELDAAGQVLRVSVTDRPRSVGRSTLNTPWSGEFREHQKRDGMVIPTYAEASWHLDGGTFTYWRGRVLEFRVLALSSVSQRP